MKLSTLLEQIYIENDGESTNLQIDKKMTEKTLEDTFSVSDRGLEYIKQELERLNKKAGKIGVKPLTLKVVGKKEEKLGDGDIKVTHEVKIEGDSPIIDGYEFIANVEHTNEGNIINISPNSSVKSLPNEFRHAGATCDHCHTKRDRNNTFVLKDTKTGEFKRVGRNCLKNFMPDVDPKAIIGFAMMLEKALNICVGGEDMDDGDGGGGGGERGAFSKYYGASGFLIYICAAYLLSGKYISGAKAKQSGEFGDNPLMSTAQYAKTLKFTTDAGLRDEYNRIYPRAEELAKKVEEWKDTVDWDTLEAQKPELANYFQNMRVIAKSSAIQYKNAGYHASLLAMYLREQGQKEKDIQNKASAANKTYIGQIGEKIQFVGKIVKMRGFSTQYGQGMIYIFNDIDNGNEVIWFSSSDVGNAEGDSVKVKGTVKAHQVSKFNQSPQTVITRAKIEQA